MRHFTVSPDSVITTERVYLIDRTNNKKGKGEGGRGEVHNIRKLSERHQKKGPTNGGTLFLKDVNLTFDEPTLCDEIPPAGVRCTERTWQHKFSKADTDDSNFDISQEQTRICSSTLLRKVRRSASHYCTVLLVPELRVRRW